MNESIIKKMFPEESERIKNNKCPICNEEINMADFREALSRKEYGISKMCQKCQDKIFG